MRVLLLWLLVRYSQKSCRRWYFLLRFLICRFGDTRLFFSPIFCLLSPLDASDHSAKGLEYALQGRTLAGSSASESFVVSTVDGHVQTIDVSTESFSHRASDIYPACATAAIAAACSILLLRMLTYNASSAFRGSVYTNLLLAFPFHV